MTPARSRYETAHGRASKHPRPIGGPGPASTPAETAQLSGEEPVPIRRWRLYTRDGEDIGTFAAARWEWRIGDELTDEKGTRFRVLDVSGFANELDDHGLGEFVPVLEFTGALVVTPLELAEPR